MLTLQDTKVDCNVRAAVHGGPGHLREIRNIHPSALEAGGLYELPTSQLCLLGAVVTGMDTSQASGQTRVVSRL